MLSKLLLFGATLASIPCSQAWEYEVPPAGAIYMLNNDANQASVVAVGTSPDGALMSTATTSTGGTGLSGVTGTGQPGVGSLFGSDAIVVEDNYIFVVNPGSNTVSMFSIKPSDPLHPILVGTPADTLGEFPMSLTYSSSLSTVCVLNGGAKGGVTCFSVNDGVGLKALDTAPRDISNALNQTTPPVGPFLTASDIKFNPSSSALFATVKGSPVTAPLSVGSLFVWPVVDGVVSREAVVTRNPNLILDFSITFATSDFDFLLTDPAIGADVLSLSFNKTINLAEPVKITGQAATCWSTYNSVSEVFYTADAAETNITVVSAVDGTILDTVKYDASTKGGLDLIVSGSNLYLLTQIGQIVSFDVADGKAPRPVQVFDPLPKTNSSGSVLNGMGAWTRLRNG